MSVPTLALVFVGALATLATIGLFIDFGDAATRSVVGFAGSLLWLLMGMSSFDVQTTNYGLSQPVMPLVFLGFGFSAVVAIFSFNVLRKSIQTEVEESSTSIFS